MPQGRGEQAGDSLPSLEPLVILYKMGEPSCQTPATHLDLVSRHSWAKGDG